MGSASTTYDGAVDYSMEANATVGIDVFAHAPWQANFTPPSDAESGDQFTVTAVIKDVDANPDGLRPERPVNMTVRATGKPEHLSGEFTVDVGLDRTSIKWGQNVNATCNVAGNPQGELTYAWTATQRGWGSANRRYSDAVDPVPTGRFRNPDQASTTWQSWRIARPDTEGNGTKEGPATLTCTVTDASGGERDGGAGVTVTIP